MEELGARGERWIIRLVDDMEGLSAEKRQAHIVEALQEEGKSHPDLVAEVFWGAYAGARDRWWRRHSESNS